MSSRSIAGIKVSDLADVAAPLAPAVALGGLSLTFRSRVLGWAAAGTGALGAVSSVCQLFQFENKKLDKVAKAVADAGLEAGTFTIVASPLLVAGTVAVTRPATRRGRVFAGVVALATSGASALALAED